MTIATDPKSDTNIDSDDGFGKHFEAFASGKPLPEAEGKEEPGEPEGNDPEDETPAPAPAATDPDQPTDDVTSGTAETEGDDQPPAVEQAPDPWKDAPPELIAARDQLQKERDEAEHRAKSDASRVAALSRKLQQFTVTPSAPPAPEPTEAQKAIDAEIDRLKQDYPEIAEPLLKKLEAQARQLDSVTTTLTGMSETQQAQVIETERQALTQAHPDWAQIGQSPEFNGWLEVQPENIQRLATSWDARETSVALTLFKAEMVGAAGQRQPQQPKADAATDTRRSQQLEGGRDVRSRPAPAASGPPEDFDAAFKYYEEKRRLAATK